MGILQRIINAAQKKKQNNNNNQIAQQILEQSNPYRGIYNESGVLSEPPLVDEHPEAYVATMAAQPVGVATNALGYAWNAAEKAIAPYVYKNMIQGLINGEDALSVAGTPGFKFKSLQELGGIKDGLQRSVSGTVSKTANNRVSFKTTKKVDTPKTYEKVNIDMESVPTVSESPKSVTTHDPSKPWTSQEVRELDPAAHLNALQASQEAAAQGLDDLAAQFYNDYQWLNPQRDTFKSRFIYGELYKVGGKLK